MSDAPAWVASFREWFGLAPGEARLLLALYRSAGASMSAVDLSLATGITEGTVRVYVGRLRAAMQPEALDCERSQGYRLTQIGLDECAAAIRDMATELQA